MIDFKMIFSTIVPKSLKIFSVRLKAGFRFETSRYIKGCPSNLAAAKAKVAILRIAIWL